MRPAFPFEHFKQCDVVRIERIMLDHLKMLGFDSPFARGGDISRGGGGYVFHAVRVPKCRVDCTKNKDCPRNDSRWLAKPYLAL